MNSRFENRAFIVTGASREPSIGRATAARLGAEGASLVINAREEAPLREAEAALRARGVDVVALAGSADDDQMPARLTEANSIAPSSGARSS